MAHHGGPRFGKTRAGAQWIHELARRRRKIRIALVGATIAEARSVMVEGTSGLIEVAASEGVKLKWEPSLGVLRWPSGAIAQLFSGDNADGLRGPEHDYAWCDELAKWRQGPEAWKNLQLGLRRGARARAVVTTTPKSIDLIKTIIADPWTVTTTGRMTDNLNLDDKFRDVMTATYGGTRIGRQELDGELILDVAGALWTRELIAASRRPALTPGPSPESGRGEMERIVVGVDPPAGTDGDACGIVVCGKATDATLHVLEDASVAGLSPEGWANRVAAAAARWRAGLIVAEAITAGAMAKTCSKPPRPGCRIRLVPAPKGQGGPAPTRGP